jgi:hypothetical protein
MLSMGPRLRGDDGGVYWSGAACSAWVPAFAGTTG